MSHQSLPVLDWFCETYATGGRDFRREFHRCHARVPTTFLPLGMQPVPRPSTGNAYAGTSVAFIGIRLNLSGNRIEPAADPSEHQLWLILDINEMDIRKLDLNLLVVLDVLLATGSVT